MPTYPGDPDVTLAPDATHEEDGYATSELRTGTHAGTHVDAPRHTLPEGSRSTSERWASSRSTRALVDLRPLEPREAITAEELPEPNVLDPAVDLLVFRTGWAAHWGPIGTATTRT